MSEDRFDNFADYWAEGTWSNHVEHLHSAGSRRFSLALLNQPAGSYPDPGFDEFNVQLILQGSFRADVAFGDERFSMRGRPGSLIVAPPGIDCEYRIDGGHRVAMLAIDENVIRRFREQCEAELPSDFGTLHSRAFADPVIETLVREMIDHMKRPHVTSALFLESATNAILASLFHRSTSGGAAVRQAIKPLAAEEIDKVCSLIEERLDEDISISDLAVVTSLSDSHFARAFKASTGQSPHQFVLRRRIARAKELLAHGKLPLAELSVAAGFSSQSHMTDVFRQKVGTTPGRYRRELAPGNLRAEDRERQDSTTRRR